MAHYYQIQLLCKSRKRFQVVLIYLYFYFNEFKCLLLINNSLYLLTLLLCITIMCFEVGLNDKESLVKPGILQVPNIFVYWAISKGYFPILSSGKAFLKCTNIFEKSFKIIIVLNYNLFYTCLLIFCSQWQHILVWLWNQFSHYH